MSELTDSLDHYARHGMEGEICWEDQDRCAVELADKFRSMLEAHNREIELATARDVLEAACKLRCGGCACGHPVVEARKHWRHPCAESPMLPPFACAASDIRNAVLALYPELAQPMKGGSDAAPAS